MPANQWISQMKSRGVKQDELTWTGVEDWLKSQDKSVTKQDLDEYLWANQIQVQEVVKQSDLGPAVSPRYEEYTLPGGENYRELVLTLPSKKMVDPVKRYEELNDIVARRNLTDAEQAEMLAIENQQFNQESGTVGTDFVSGHYKEPNIIAHIRFNERVDADGNKVLFIEEIQSDWAQKGRKEGFLTKKQERTQSLIDEKDKMVARAETGMSESGGTLMRIQADDLDRYNEIEKLLAEIPPEDYPGYQAGLGSKVPAAPFVMDTNQWTSLALKRMVRWATDNGFDQIAWTTGKQQAKRYDLSKQIDKIEVRKNDQGNYVLQLEKSGQYVGGYKVNSEEELERYVGKDLAEKIIKDDRVEQGGGFVGYSGLDLEVGGEGMSGYYDKIVVDQARKLGKQYGSKVEKGEIVTDDGKIEMPNQVGVPLAQRKYFRTKPIKAEAWTMNLTDKLKKAAKDGLPYYVVLPPLVAGVASQQAETSDEMTSPSLLY
jgi:hypothetical protein